MKRKVFSILFAAVMAVSLAACGGDGGSGNADTADGGAQPGQEAGNASGDSAGGEEQVLIVSINGDPTSFNPDAVTDDNAGTVADNLYSGLLALNNNEEIIPDLAESWEISEDGLTYTFHLRPEVKWHDGEAFTSEDVKFTYEMIIENEGYLAKDLSIVSSMECPDENTIVITLKEASAPFLASLAWYSNSILPKHLYEGVEDWTTCEAATTNPIGTGPFKYVESKSGVSITLERNWDYFGGQPILDKVIYVVSTDADTTYQAFLNGEIDYITDVPAANVSTLEADSAYKIGCLSAARRYQMCFNMNGTYTKDLAVRQAIAKAIDRQEISAKGTNGLQAPAYGFYPPFLDWAYNDQADIGSKDTAMAVQLLEDAGYTKDADGYYMHLTLEVFSGGTYADCGKVIKSQLDAVGIDVTIEELEEGAWVEKVFSGNYDLCILAGMQGPDPDNMTNRIGTGGGLNVSFYSNAEVDDLLAQARVTSDQEERGAMYKQIQQILSEDLPLVPLVEYAGYYACPSNITGLPYIDTSVDELAPGNFGRVSLNLD